MARRFHSRLALWALLRTLSLSPLLLLAADAATATELRLSERLFLVRDRPGTPTQFRMIVGAGCTDEAGGNCRGLAHYLEHLLLSGRDPEHKEVALRLFPDGSSNGWTSQRATVYAHTMPAREQGPRADLEKLFGFYAARLKDFAVSEADAERERGIVRQEHDWRVASRPFARLARRLDRLLLPDHPSGQWVIGTAEDIAGFRLEDARAFHRAWYAINNIAFVVMADIEPAVLAEVAERALAGLEPRGLARRAFAAQPAIVNGRTDIVEQEATIQRPGVYFKKLVRIEEDDAQAMGAVRLLATNFLASRLPDSLHDVIVERGRLAAGASIGLGRIAPRTVVITIAADVAGDVAPEQLLAAITAYVEKPPAISAETLARLKTRYADGRAAADKDPRQVYSRLVNWLAGRNRYEQLAGALPRVAAVSPEQVARLLEQLSGPGRIVTGTLVPAPDARQ